MKNILQIYLFSLYVLRTFNMPWHPACTCLRCPLAASTHLSFAFGIVPLPFSPGESTETNLPWPFFLPPFSFLFPFFPKMEKAIILGWLYTWYSLLASPVLPYPAASQLPAPQSCFYFEDIYSKINTYSLLLHRYWISVAFIAFLPTGTQQRCRILVL